MLLFCFCRPAYVLNPYYIVNCNLSNLKSLVSRCNLKSLLTCCLFPVTLGSSSGHPVSNHQPRKTFCPFSAKEYAPGDVWYPTSRTEIGDYCIRCDCLRVSLCYVHNDFFYTQMEQCKISPHLSVFIEIAHIATSKCPDLRGNISEQK